MEDGLKPTIYSYELSGKRVYSDFPESGVAGWQMYLFYGGDLGNMEYSLYRTDFRKAGEFCFTYTAAETSGRLAADGEKASEEEWTEYEFPIELEEGRLKYSGNAPYDDATLRFEEKPKAAFTRIRYDDGTAGKPEKLVAVQNEDGMWYLTLAERERAYLYSYRFDQEQVLEFTSEE